MSYTKARCIGSGDNLRHVDSRKLRRMKKRLAARVAGMPINSDSSKFFYRKPGSQNRKK